MKSGVQTRLRPSYFVLRTSNLPLSLCILPERLPQFLQERVGVAALRDVVRPPRIVALGLGGGQREDQVHRAKRCAAIAATPRQLAQREQRRLRRRIERRRSLVRRARLRESRQRFLGGVRASGGARSEEQTSELQSRFDIVFRLLRVIK